MLSLSKNYMKKLYFLLNNQDKKKEKYKFGQNWRMANIFKFKLKGLKDFLRD